jgi:hypothetical protein
MQRTAWLRRPALAPIRVRDELIAVLREAIERNRYFMSPRVKRLRGILAKFDPPPPRPEPYPSPKPPGQHSAVLAKKRHRPR